ncbi:ATP phosphoribosyltransferase regulatory subunit [Acidovorax sp. 106]|uniref:ATP phosphoribosyltransferase regulatory subunit n=1 Tax=Acidovorax sp. 106 TaxID=2135637 RepID=UPI000EAC7A7B|nr:ATP phosphoribosyltransferase regulatory subunit [Acidovorax sp. 106]RLJ36700.1 ATP phosphoribosyltransferase regulatory subunit [Acidovorax sp. 106]
MSAWILPDHVADVLPSEARHIEELRRGMLDTARSYGYELVIPPMLEHLDSLLTGAGEALSLQTFKLVDQLSGRSMGLRADTTQQVARIDAHLLNRPGVTRLCYCGPVLHTRPDKPHATREPLQFGAEIYGHAGLEADIEALTLAVECLHRAGIAKMTIDLADVRIVRCLLAGLPVSPSVLRDLHGALARKDLTEIDHLSESFPKASRDGLMALPGLFGDASVLDKAQRVLGCFPGVADLVDELKRLASAFSDQTVTFDLADLRGYSYYSGVRFAVFAPGAPDAMARGGRYDEVGAAFGRNRPAAGFSLDIKQIVGVVPARSLQTAIRAPWVDCVAVKQAVIALRSQGETVVCVLPGHESDADEFNFDRELVEISGRWTVRAI